MYIYIIYIHLTFYATDSTGELLVIVEYCRFGNLHNYLLRHRADFINQIDPATGKLDPSIGLDILTRTTSVGSNNRYVANFTYLYAVAYIFLLEFDMFMVTGYPIRLDFIFLLISLNPSLIAQCTYYERSSTALT